MSDSDEGGSASRLTRRALLGGAFALGALSCAHGPGNAVSPPAASGPGRGPQAGFELEELTLAQLQEGLASGRWTARSLTQAYLARIAELEPTLQAVIETNPDALAAAERCDRER
jgi:amidase